MNKKAKIALKDHFDENIAFDKATRFLYSRDVGSLPRLISLLIKHVPDAVFLPKNENDIVQLYQIAREHKIPVIPRGSGSSGYGGALAYRGGIMIDLSAMREVEKISQETMTVIAGAGITFASLESKLGLKGLALRSYPSSAPSATLGGWFAQGGSGIGTLQYGSFQDQVLSLRLIQPNGEIKDLSQGRIAQHYELEGTTGIFSRLTIKTRQAIPIIPILGTYKSIKQVLNSINTIIQKTTPFTIIIGTPSFLRLRQEATGDSILPNDSYYALIAVEASDEVSSSLLTKSIESSGGNVEHEDNADHEWKERFYPMRLKRLGPGIILGESYLPLNQIDNYLETINQRFRRDEPSSEVILISKKEAAVLTYFLDDDRRFTGMFAWSKAFQILKLAEKLGGRPYSTGLWLSGRSKQYFGSNRLSEIKKLRKSSDPCGISNPGKITGGKTRVFPLIPISVLLKLASPFMRMGNSIFRYKRKKTHPPASWHGRKTLG
ncbi:MAG: FAD-binding oxidoreductase [Candidatus Hodarchaeota archaeon]